MGRAIAITRTDISAQELRFIAKRTRDCRVVWRILAIALFLEGVDRATSARRTLLMNENGSSYVSGELAEWLHDKGMKRSRGAPYHSQTQGKIERWHQTLKNRTLLENYFLPGSLEAQIEAFVEHHHESLRNVKPFDVYFGRGKANLKQRERISQQVAITIMQKKA
jgi:putative transposase